MNRAYIEIFDPSHKSFPMFVAPRRARLPPDTGGRHNMSPQCSFVQQSASHEYDNLRTPRLSCTVCLVYGAPKGVFKPDLYGEMFGSFLRNCGLFFV